jgi:hypothetical protein
MAQAEDLAARVGGFDWGRLGEQLDGQGWAVARLLGPDDCSALKALWDDDSAFRKRVVMERHAYGQGLYKYWDYPLPAPIAALRPALYRALAPKATEWLRRIGVPAEPFPTEHASYLSRCHAAGQAKPTPLILRYEAEGWNALHQDLYGDHVFPMQATILLSRPGRDFEGGEFVLVEQRPRAQSRAEVVPLGEGDMVVFAVNHRPVKGSRGWHRVALRHGVSRVRSGRRYTLGIILHDAAS